MTLFRLRPTLAAAALFAALLPARGAEFHAETFKLANGLEVVVLPDHRVPVVTHMVWYRIGAADDPRGKSGIAHFLEHLMFKGTAHISPGEFSKIVARNGGQDNAFTTRDYTAYFERVAKDRLALVMEMEADRMQGLVLNDAIVLPERDVIIEERSQRIDNDPSSLMNEQMNAALFLSHPYGIPVIGWRHEMAGLTREDAIAAYRAHYAPNNAILIVAGDVTGEEVRALAEKFYGRLKPAKVPPRLRPAEPPPIAARRLVLEDARAQQPSVSRDYLAPSYPIAEGNEAYALDVAAEILGGGGTSRLYRILVEEQKLAAGADAGYDGDAIDASSFSVGAVPREGVSLDVLEAGMDKIIADFVANGPTADELARAKSVMRAAAIYARDNQSTMARIYGVALATNQTIEGVETWPDRIGAVTAEEVKAAAAKYLVMSRSVTGRLVPKANP